jgi:Arc/MetJ-type ribon-helix-helix transcriptional regulator
MMTSGISPENEQFIEGEILEGAYQDRGEVLNAGIRLLRARKELAGRLAESRRQLDEGEYTEHDVSGLREFFGDLKKRMRMQTEVSGE